ncbi:MAG: hypothetical protein OEY96_13395 [Gammaproteobacteria bacterium]|nr:hypothetical protein [Gammaproteobacteria bacterium]
MKDNYNNQKIPGMLFIFILSCVTLFFQGIVIVKFYNYDGSEVFSHLCSSELINSQSLSCYFSWGKWVGAFITLITVFFSRVKFWKSNKNWWYVILPILVISTSILVFATTPIIYQ